MFRKVKAGDPIDRSASTHNATIDAAAYVRQQVGGPSGRRVGSPANADCVLVRNISGDIQQRYTALAFRQPVISPSANQDEFNRRVVMAVDTPVSGDEGHWCVLLDTLEDQQIGVAVVSGIVQCKINLLNLDDKFAEIVDGEVNPHSTSAGLGSILWTAGTATGVQDSIIRIGGSGAGLPIGQYPGMFWGVVTSNQSAYAYPFSVQTVG
jgi:hypothetical protein